VNCNWKFLMQNTSETYHTSFVHRDSLGPMPSEPIATYYGKPPVGQWDAVHVPGERSIVPMPGEAAPFPQLPTAPSTFFISLFPTLQLNVTRDCAWWMRVLPDGPCMSRVTLGFLFPRATTTMPNFEQLLAPYRHRWDVAIQEDNEISVNQQKASESPHHRPGPYHSLEFGVHRFDNMVLDAVLEGEARASALASGNAWFQTAAPMPFSPPGAGTPNATASAATANPINMTSRPSLMPSAPVMLGQQQQPPQAQQVTMQLQTTYSSSRSSSADASGQSPSASSLAPGAHVCVTGASGFIALHLVEQLLAAGHPVTAAVRTNDPAKLAPLDALRASYGHGQLQVVSGCDLMEPGSFAHAVGEASVCFHTASPFWMDARITDPWGQLVRPAEQGTRNVLDACAASASNVRRVVLTSSFAALMNVGGHTPWPLDFAYDESHWNVSSAPAADGTFPEPVNAHAYRWSKTVAERAAWEAVEACGGKLELVTILPPMVLGENKQELAVSGGVDALNQSSLILYNLLAGKMEHVPPGSVGFVDVADVARAHVLGAQVASAAGQRYLCSGETKTWLEVVATLRQLYPDAPLPTTCPDGSTTQPCLLLRNDKIRAELGLEFVPLEQTLKAQASAFVDAGLLEL